MGHEVEKVAVARGHEVVITLDSPEEWEKNDELIRSCDILIDFSTPQSAAFAVNRCFDLGLPVVSGTTGWSDGLSKAIERSRTGNYAFFYAPNFSIGVNIFFQINRQLARLMNRQTGYSADIHEIHHIHKLDAPSGTAIALATGIMEENEAYSEWSTGNNPGKGKLPVTSERIGEVNGTHIVRWSSDTDDIEIKHTAHSRRGFALGAILAAEWLKGRKGFFGMADLLNSNH